MEKYSGNIQLFCDGPNNPVALAGLVDYVEKNIDYGRISGTETEKEDLKAAIKIAVKKLQLPAIPRLNTSNFRIECLIGYGSFGRIWKADSENLGPVALKQQKIEMNFLTALWNERDLMILLKNNRICNLLAAFHDRDVFFVLELCHGSVTHLRNRISPRNAVRFSVQLLDGLKWLHSNNVIHADLKSDNCLINSANNLVLSDFGSSFHLTKNELVVKTKTSHGSPGYMDYQANKDLVFSFDTDVFSAACVIFEMDTKAHLLYYHGQNQTRELYVNAFDKGRIQGLTPTDDFITTSKKRESLSDRAMSSEFGFLLQKLITDKGRLSASDALQDPSLRLILKAAQVNMGNLDNDQNYVTREYNVDHSTQFSFYENFSPPEVELALLTFHFEKQENPSSDDEEIASEDEELVSEEENVLVVPKSKPGKRFTAPRKRRFSEANQEADFFEEDENDDISDVSVGTK